MFRSVIISVFSHDTPVFYLTYLTTHPAGFSSNMWSTGTFRPILHADCQLGWEKTSLIRGLKHLVAMLENIRL